MLGYNLNVNLLIYLSVGAMLLQISLWIICKFGPNGQKPQNFVKYQHSYNIPIQVIRVEFAKGILGGILFTVTSLIGFILTLAVGQVSVWGQYAFIILLSVTLLRYFVVHISVIKNHSIYFKVAPNLIKSYFISILTLTLYRSYVIYILANIIIVSK